MLKKLFFAHSGHKSQKKENNFAPNSIFLYHLLV